MLQNPVKYENQDTYRATGEAHKPLQPLDINFLLTFGRHRIVARNQFGESPDEKPQKDKECRIHNLYP